VATVAARPWDRFWFVRWPVCGLVVLLLLASCQGRAPSDTGEQSGRVGVAYSIPMRCQDGKSTAHTPPSYEAVLGIVALPVGGRPDDVLPTTETGHADPALRLFASVDLLVKRGAGGRFTIQVPPSLYDRVAVGWGYEQAPTHRYEGYACAAFFEDGGEWLGFSGGIWVTDPECVTVIVRSEDGRSETVHVGVGTPC